MLTNKIKILAQSTPPNPKEVDYWINTKVDPYGGLIMNHNGKDWHPVNEHHDLFQEELIRQEVARAKAAEDTIEQAVGLHSNGTFKPIGGNFTNGATSTANAILKLDNKVKNLDDIISVGGDGTKYLNDKGSYVRVPSVAELNLLIARVTELEERIQALEAA